MLWPIILPLKITVCVIAGLIVVATAAAPAIKWKRRPTFLVATSLGMVAVIPSCTAIMNVMDDHRFGVFEIAQADAGEVVEHEQFMAELEREDAK